MAISFSEPTNGCYNDNNDLSAYTTSSISFTDGVLFLIFVWASDTAAITAPTISSTGLDGETQIVTVERTEGSARRRTTAFHALGNGGSATLTANFSATMNGCAISVIEATGTETGGTGGADAIVQSATGSSGTPVSVTLSSFADAGNGCVIGGNLHTNVTPSGDGSLVDRCTGNHNNDKMGWVSATLVGEDTSPSFSWSGESEGGCGVAFEVSVPTAVATRRYSLPVMGVG